MPTKSRDPVEICFNGGQLCFCQIEGADDRMHLIRRALLIAVLATGLAMRLGTAHAADAWDGPAFATPARELLQAASAVTRERPTDIVVLLDERIFVFDAQHRVTQHQPPDLPRRFARRRRELGGEHRALAALAPGAAEDPRARHHHRRARAPDRPEPADRVRHARPAARSTTTTTCSKGPLPAVAIGAVVEEEITVRDEQPFFAAGSVFREFVGPAGADTAHPHRHRCARNAAAEARHAPAAQCAGQGSARQRPRALDARAGRGR